MNSPAQIVDQLHENILFDVLMTPNENLLNNMAFEVTFNLKCGQMPFFKNQLFMMNFSVLKC